MPRNEPVLLLWLLLFSLPAGGGDRLSSDQPNPRKTASAPSLAVFFWTRGHHDPIERRKDLPYRRRAHREHSSAAASRAPDPLLPDPRHRRGNAGPRDAPPAARHPAGALRPAAGGHGPLLDPRSRRRARLRREAGGRKEKARGRARATDARVQIGRAH